MDKSKKEKFNPKIARAELKQLFSRIIRERDKICQKCQKHNSTQAAHIFSERHLSTRWLPDNGIGLCYYCHIYWSHREPVEFTLWIIEKIGKRKFNFLDRKRKERAKFNKDFYLKTKKELTNYLLKITNNNDK